MRPVPLLSLQLVARTVASPLGRRLAPGVVAGVVLLTWLWVALPIADLRRAASGTDPMTAATIGLLLLVAQALVLGPRLGGVLLGPGLAWLRRQPLGGGPWSLALAPWLLLPALPCAMVALMWPWPGSLALLGCWAALGALLLLPAAAGLRGIVPGAASACGAWGLLWLASSGPSGLVVAILLAWGALLAGSGRLYLWLAARPGGVALGLPGRPRSPMGALLRRDLLALLRRAPGSLVAALLLPLAPLALLWAFRASAQLSEPGLLLAARVLLALGTPTVLVVLGRLVDLLGARFDAPREPASPGLRVASLALLAAGVHAPALALALVLLRPPLVGALGLALLSVAMVSGMVVVIGWSGGRRARPANVGTFLAWTTVVVAMACAPWPVGTLTSLAAACGGLAVVRWRLAMLRRRKT